MAYVLQLCCSVPRLSLSFALLSTEQGNIPSRLSQPGGQGGLACSVYSSRQSTVRDGGRRYLFDTSDDSDQPRHPRPRPPDLPCPPSPTLARQGSRDPYAKIHHSCDRPAHKRFIRLVRRARSPCLEFLPIHTPRRASLGGPHRA